MISPSLSRIRYTDLLTFALDSAHISLHPAVPITIPMPSSTGTMKRERFDDSEILSLVTAYLYVTTAQPQYQDIMNVKRERIYTSVKRLMGSHRTSSSLQSALSHWRGRNPRLWIEEVAKAREDPQTYLRELVSVIRR